MIYWVVRILRVYLGVNVLDCGLEPSCVILVQAAGRKYGKTLLASRIVSTLASRGMHVVALKHVHHGSPDLMASKDAERLYLSGSIVSIAWGGDTSLAILSPRRGDPFRFAGMLASFLGLERYVLVVEGFRGSELRVRGCLVEIVDPGPGRVRVECGGESRFMSASEAVEYVVGRCGV